MYVTTTKTTAEKSTHKILNILLSKEFLLILTFKFFSLFFKKNKGILNYITITNKNTLR